MRPLASSRKSTVPPACVWVCDAPFGYLSNNHSFPVESGQVNFHFLPLIRFATPNEGQFHSDFHARLRKSPPPLHYLPITKLLVRYLLVEIPNCKKLQSFVPRLVPSGQIPEILEDYLIPSPRNNWWTFVKFLSTFFKIESSIVYPFIRENFCRKEKGNCLLIGWLEKEDVVASKQEGVGDQRDCDPMCTWNDVIPGYTTEATRGNWVIHFSGGTRLGYSRSKPAKSGMHMEAQLHVPHRRLSRFRQVSIDLLPKLY